MNSSGEYFAPGGAFLRRVGCSGRRSCTAPGNHSPRPRPAPVRYRRQRAQTESRSAHQGVARAAPVRPCPRRLLYTDGLIEAPGSDLDSRLGRPRRHALALAHETLDALCDRLSARMSPGGTDDIALLALRLPVR
ncbi:SpoIIE family protein phosphatase [Streptomyces sp. NPDC047453]|uniref:SpoIIE family protein phosphatase n=1 Tax=Streptomyces sp. NPDC047453 TaxID=3154812 RepID=UPI0033E64B1D